MEDRETEWRMLLLFPPRRKNPDTPITNLQYGLGHISLLIPDLNPMQPLNPHFLHLIGDRVPAIACQAIHAGPYQEVGPGSLRSTEEFIDVALAVANVHFRSCSRVPVGRAEFLLICKGSR